jgi:hypothetical protein
MSWCDLLQFGQQGVDDCSNLIGTTRTSHLTSADSNSPIPVEPIERLIEKAFRYYGDNRVVFELRLARLRESSEVQQN